MRRVFLTVAAASLSLVSCFSTNNPSSPVQHASKNAIVATSISLDYSAASIGLYSIDDSVAYQNLLPIFTDNDLRAYNGALYVIERYGKDNIIKIAGPVIAESTVVYEKNIGASVNIQDIAFVSSTKAYITQYGSSQVVIFNPTTGAKSTATVDLSKFNTYAGTDSATTVPNMSRALYDNGKVYVACQRLKAPPGGYIQAADTSLIVVINSTTDSVEKAIKLGFKNPQELSICNNKLYVGSAGMYGANDGGIECIDLSTGLNLGPVVGEAALGGDFDALIVINDTKGYAVISNAQGTAEVHPFNPQSKSVGGKIAGIDDACWNHLAYDGAYVYVGDRSRTAPGIVQIDPTGDTKVGSTKNIGLPPNSLVFLHVDE